MLIAQPCHPCLARASQSAPVFLSLQLSSELNSLPRTLRRQLQSCHLRFNHAMADETTDSKPVSETVPDAPEAIPAKQSVHSFKYDGLTTWMNETYR